MTRIVILVIVSAKFLAEGMTLLQELQGDVSSDTPKARRRILLLDVATELFIQQGFRKTTVDEVAQRAGVAKGTVYLYYKNKVRLVLGCMAREKLSIMGDFEFLADPELGPRRKLMLLVERAMTAPLRMPLGASIMRRGEIAAVLAEAPPEMIKQGNDNQAELFAGLLRQSLPKGMLSDDELASRAQVLVGASYMAGHVEETQARGKLSPAGFARAFARSLVSGALNPSPILPSYECVSEADDVESES